MSRGAAGSVSHPVKHSSRECRPPLLACWEGQCRGRVAQGHPGTRSDGAKIISQPPGALHFMTVTAPHVINEPHREQAGGSSKATHLNTSTVADRRVI